MFLIDCFFTSVSMCHIKFMFLFLNKYDLNFSLYDEFSLD